MPYEELTPTLPRWVARTTCGPGGGAARGVRSAEVDTRAEARMTPLVAPRPGRVPRPGHPRSYFPSRLAPSLPSWSFSVRLGIQVRRPRQGGQGDRRLGLGGKVVPRRRGVGGRTGSAGAAESWWRSRSSCSGTGACQRLAGPRTTGRNEPCRSAFRGLRGRTVRPGPRRRLRGLPRCHRVRAEAARSRGRYRSDP